jgi:superfamily I DNA/RNA helicase
MKWTDQQNAVFEWFSKPKDDDRALLVRARAGTGKTSTVLEALNHAPEVRRGRVLLAAFNKRVAEELAGRAPRGVHAKTLHSVGISMIYGRYGKIEVNSWRGRNVAQEVCGEQARKELIVGVAKLASIGKLKLADSPARLMALATAFDCEPTPDMGIVKPIEFAELAYAAMERAAEKVVDIDFDDMLWVPAKNQLSPAQYDLVVIDEAQDMNEAQLRMARSCVRKGGRIAVVGDDRQGIYGFMGADPESIDRMKAELSAFELPLSTTFRCPSMVVDLARIYVPDYQSMEDAPEGEVEYMPDPESIGEHAQAGDFVLSRTNAGAVEACLLILQAGVRATVLGRDIGSSLQKLVDSFRANDILGIIAAASKWAAEEVKSITTVGGDQKKIDLVLDKQKTIVALCRGISTVYDLTRRIDMLFSEGSDATVLCSTVHKAKGLEAENVYIWVPSFKESRNTEDDNLKYVALTRTKNRLVFVGKGEGDVFPTLAPVSKTSSDGEQEDLL